MFPVCRIFIASLLWYEILGRSEDSSRNPQKVGFYFWQETKEGTKLQRKLGQWNIWSLINQWWLHQRSASTGGPNWRFVDLKDELLIIKTCLLRNPQMYLDFPCKTTYTAMNYNNRGWLNMGGLWLVVKFQRRRSANNEATLSSFKT